MKLILISKRTELALLLRDRKLTLLSCPKNLLLDLLWVTNLIPLPGQNDLLQPIAKRQEKGLFIYRGEVPYANLLSIAVGKQHSRQGKERSHGLVCVDVDAQSSQR
ncbi:hypothetical protein Salmi_Mp117 (mitochondrion) [Salvia miltiorrhiza]|uniref:Uncharacterized protein n=1 Tax=Salvia miltiorrhiza TaxID=226208 RepID=V9P4T6_SALMI|nr:hypothetical protein Salmi_Mp117 [Salvia miltiorrhiza]AGU16645.1 hypothetical protein Salmi_Mp117 [Salvia miltiorrhiza]